MVGCVAAPAMAKQQSGRTPSALCLRSFCSLPPLLSQVHCPAPGCGPVLSAHPAAAQLEPGVCTLPERPYRRPHRAASTNKGLVGGADGALLSSGGSCGSGAAAAGGPALPCHVVPRGSALATSPQPCLFACLPTAVARMSILLGTLHRLTFRSVTEPGSVTGLLLDVPASPGACAACALATQRLRHGLGADSKKAPVAPRTPYRCRPRQLQITRRFKRAVPQAVHLCFAPAGNHCESPKAYSRTTGACLSSGT